MTPPREKPLSPADRPPPYDPRAEDAAIGSCLHDPRMLDEIADIVAPADFFQPTREVIYSALLTMAESGTEISTITLADYLTRAGSFEKVGGDETLAKVCDAVPPGYGFDAVAYARIVRGHAITRGLIDAATETLRECYSKLHTPPDLLCSAEERIFAVAEREAAGAAVGMDVSVDEAMARMEVRRRGEWPGIFTGFVQVDEYLCGLQPGQLAILAARPSQGKTALAMDVARFVVAREGRVLFFSLEMSRASLVDRLLSSVSGVPLKRVQRPDLQSRQDAIDIGNAAGRLHGMAIRIDDRPARTLSQISAIARREKRRHGLDLIVIDYLSLIDGRPGRNDSREQEVAKISRGLKEVAKNVAVPVLALQQLNRQAEGRADHRPRMWDLRESGQIEQDADVIMLLHRPEKYDPADRPGEADLDIAKNRDGETGVVTLAFEGSCVRFSNLSRRIPDVAAANGAPPF